MKAWAGTIANVIGAFSVALGFTIFGYSFFLLGAITWASIARARRDNALLTLNIVFTCANIVGLVNYW